MAYAFFFIGVWILSYFLGSRLRERQPLRNQANRLSGFFVILMVILMGLRMGINEEVVRSMGSIGVMSAIITIVIWIVTVGLITVSRKFLGISKWALSVRTAGRDLTASHAGHSENIGANTAESGDVSRAGPDGTSEEFDGGKPDYKMTIQISASTIGGILAGYFLIRPMMSAEKMASLDNQLNWWIMFFLTLMIICIGYDMGLDGTAFPEIKRAGLKVLAIPVVIFVATGVGGVICGLVIPQLSVGESLAVSYGYGWYTLAPGIITAAGHEIAGAVSFLHNMFREVGGLMLIPLLARKIGYLETASLPGISAMDMCLPVLARSTRYEIVAYAFAIGITEIFYTTIMVPICVGL